MARDDRNDLAYWFPKLQASGVPVPRTEVLTTDVALDWLLDGAKPDGLDDFLARLGAAAGRMGYPAFLRTGHGSGKHQWRSTCYLERPGDLPERVANLVEWSALADILGLPTRTWAVREFLPLVHDFTAFDGMPVAAECRTFFRDGVPTCIHPYWPPDSIRNPSRPDWRRLLDDVNAIHLSGAFHHYLLPHIRRVALRFDGAWSLDWAIGEDGTWYAIDMAEADRSFHWPGCPHA